MSSPFEIPQLQFRGTVIRRPELSPLICLTDLWIAVGNPDLRPTLWLQNHAGAALRKYQGQAADEQVEIPGVVEIDPQDNAIYSIPEVAILYARFLSRECYEWALETLVSAPQPVQRSAGSQRQRVAQSSGFAKQALVAAGWMLPMLLTGLGDQAVLAEQESVSKGDLSSYPLLIVSNRITERPDDSRRHVDGHSHFDMPIGTEHVDFKGEHGDYPNLPD